MSSISLELNIPKNALNEEKSAIDSEQGCSIDLEKKLDLQPSDGMAQAHFIEPVSIIASVTVAWIAKRLVNHWLKSKEQGVQIDLRVKPPLISKIAGVPQGFMLLIKQDGSVETIKAEYDKAEELMPILEKYLSP